MKIETEYVSDFFAHYWVATASKDGCEVQGTSDWGEMAAIRRARRKLLKHLKYRCVCHLGD